MGYLGMFREAGPGRPERKRPSLSQGVTDHARVMHGLDIPIAADEAAELSGRGAGPDWSLPSVTLTKRR
jgi:hypothetical protein